MAPVVVPVLTASRSNSDILGIRRDLAPGVLASLEAALRPWPGPRRPGLPWSWPAAKRPRRCARSRPGRWSVRAWLSLFGLALGVPVGQACASGTSPFLEPIPPQVIEVHQTLRLPLVVHGVEGRTLRFRYAVNSLPADDTAADIVVTSSGGGEFRFTPLAPHVGVHEFVFYAYLDGEEVDRVAVIVTVKPGPGTAPEFLQPGPGGTFDLDREPCVAFDIEIRDDDSRDSDLVIRAGRPLPDGASLILDGPRTAHFQWCPSSVQIAERDRWTVYLEAHDGLNPPTQRQYIILFRSQPDPSCPGDAPFLDLIWPVAGQRVTSDTSDGGHRFFVELAASDDRELSGPPRVFYGFVPIDSPADPDLATLFEAEVTALPDRFRAVSSIMSLRYGEERSVYVVAVATDDDDPAGATCDHRTISPVRTFTVAGNGVYLCLDDLGEDDDDIENSRPITGSQFFGMICKDDSDHIAFFVSGRSNVELSLRYIHATGRDLDIRLFDPKGSPLASSAGVAGLETIPRDGRPLVVEPGTYTVEVYGFNRGIGNYVGEVIATPTP